MCEEGGDVVVWKRREEETAGEKDTGQNQSPAMSAKSLGGSDETSTLTLPQSPCYSQQLVTISSPPGKN